MTSDWTYSHIRISWYVMFQRYIAIDRYMNIRAKTSHTTNPLHSFKGHSCQPRAMIFARSRYIQQSSLFYNMSQYHANPSLNSKCHFCQSRAPFSHASHCHNPATFDATRWASQPASQWQANDPRHRFRQDIIKLSSGTLARGPIKLGAGRHSDSKESLCGWSAMAWVATPHSPNSRASQIQKLLFIYTNP